MLLEDGQEAVPCPLVQDRPAGVALYLHLPQQLAEKAWCARKAAEV